MAEGCAPGRPMSRPCLYDQDADVTPAAGYERPTTCSKRCPVDIGSGTVVCRHPRACPLGVAA